MFALTANWLGRAFSRISIKWKFLLVMLAVVLTALLLVATGLTIQQRSDFRRDILKNLSILANIISDNSTASIVFDDAQSARATLSALKANPHIIAAAIYKENNRLFATYTRDAGNFDFKPSMSLTESHLFSDGLFEMTHLIRLDGEAKGMVYLISDTTELSRKLAGFIAAAAAIVLLVICGLFFMASAIQRLVTKPLLNLTDLAKKISETKNYSVRAAKETDDEIGILVNGINDLLDATESSLERVQKSEERFNVAVDGAGFGIWDSNELTGEMYVSPRYKELLGYANDELPNPRDTWFDSLHPEDKERFKATLKNHEQTRKPFDIEVRCRTKKGNYRWFHVAAHSVWNGSGKRTRMAGSLSDVTERWMLEEQLRRFFHLSGDLVCTAGFDGYFKTVNPAFTKTLGYTEQEMLSRPLVEFTHPDDSNKTSEEMSHLIAGGNTFSFENRYKHKNGKWIWLSWNSIPIPEESIIFGIARDITERKRSEEKLQHYASQLARSNRELQDFATIASHDLQEPLRKVQAFGDRLLTRCKTQLDEQGKEYLDRMLSAVTRMKTLINDLLNFSRVDTRGQPFRAVNLEDVAKDVISDLEVLIASAEAEVIVGELPVIDADATQMRQLLQNLIGNALKFRQPGTPPRVEIHAEMPNGKRSGDSVCDIVVEDNGIGFDEKYTDRIFTIFQRLHGKNEYEGTGVGLAVCRKIVERHHGSITAKSIPGKGSKFICSLPVKQQIHEENV